MFTSRVANEPKNSKMSANDRDRKSGVKVNSCQGEGRYKRSSPIGTHRAQSPDADELSFTQLAAIIVEQSELIKDKHIIHQTIKNMEGLIYSPL